MSKPELASDTYQRIVAAVGPVLAQRGVKGTTLRRVADAAGLSIGSVQYHFASRAALIEAALARHNEDLARSITEFAAGLTPGIPVADVAAQAARTVLALAWRERAFVRLRLSTILADGEQSTGVHPLFRIDYVDRIVGLLLPTSDAARRAPIRIAVQTVAFAVVRYVLLSEDELRALTGEGDVAAGLALIEEHIVALARDVVALAERTGHAR